MSKEKFAKGRQAVEKEDSKNQLKKGSAKAFNLVQALEKRGVDIYKTAELMSQKNEKQAA